MKIQTLRLLALLLVSLMLMTGALVSCTVDPTNPADTTPETNPTDTTPETDPETTPEYDTVTIAEALELCGEPGNITTERYYIRATVK
ncbi:MAG: hypothetical protein IIW36_04440, partial [Clostridia bacterium]|nr:hypothetical protein [Clostridia bacterium]